MGIEDGYRWEDQKRDEALRTRYATAIEERYGSKVMAITGAVIVTAAISCAILPVVLPMHNQDHCVTDTCKDERGLGGLFAATAALALLGSGITLRNLSSFRRARREVDELKIVMN